VQSGIEHLPSFIKELLSFDDSCACDKWWHRLQFNVFEKKISFI